MSLNKHTIDRLKRIQWKKVGVGKVKKLKKSWFTPRKSKSGPKNRNPPGRCLKFLKLLVPAFFTVKLTLIFQFKDQLNTHIISALNKTAARTLINILLSQQPSTFKLEDLKRKEYSELCTLISNEDYRGCLVELCNSLWSVMKNYYQMFMWHEKSGNLNGDIKQKFNQGKLNDVNMR